MASTSKQLIVVPRQGFAYAYFTIQYYAPTTFDINDDGYTRWKGREENGNTQKERRIRVVKASCIISY